MTTEKITIETLIQGDRKKIWEYYTNPEHIVNWNYATSEWCCPRAENNLIVGGKYVTRMEAKDGSMGFDFEAVYDEILPGEKIAYTLTDGRKVEVLFNSYDKNVQVIIKFEAETQNPIELQKQGWQSILGNFKKYSTDLNSNLV